MHVQHLLRLLSGRVVNGLRGHRLVWALVNSVLVGEAAGKGFVVHRNVMKRLGGRVEGTKVLTRGRLRELMESEETARSIVWTADECGQGCSIDADAVVPRGQEAGLCSEALGLAAAVGKAF